MKHLFPAKPRVEHLNTEKDRLLLFTPLTKEEHDNLLAEFKYYISFPKGSVKRNELDSEFYKHHNFKFSGIIAIGDTNMEHRLANSYIESSTFHVDKVVKRNYKCFVNADWRNETNSMNLPFHEDGACSWNCLMIKLRNPQYGIVYSIVESDKYKFKLNGEL